jgi:hypothetical protein
MEPEATLKELSAFGFVSSQASKKLMIHSHLPLLCDFVNCVFVQKQTSKPKNKSNWFVRVCHDPCHVAVRVAPVPGVWLLPSPLRYTTSHKIMNLTFDLFPGRTLSLWLFGEVTPVVASSLSEKLRQKSLPPVAFINPKWVRWLALSNTRFGFFGFFVFFSFSF